MVFLTSDKVRNFVCNYPCNNAKGKLLKAANFKYIRYPNENVHCKNCPAQIFGKCNNNYDYRYYCFKGVLNKNIHLLVNSKSYNAVFWGAGAPAEASQQRGLFRAATTTPC